MRRLLLLLALLPLLFLFGCSGGGTTVTTTGTPGGGSGGGGASLTNVTVTLPPYDPGAQKALIDTDGLIRNAARLVATGETVIGQECPPENVVIVEECDPEDPTFCYTVETCPGGLVDVLGFAPIAASDSALAADGSGTIGIFVPPGTGYTLHLITYVAGAVTFDAGDADTFVPYDEAGVNLLINATTKRIVLGDDDRNIILDHGTSALFNVASGDQLTLTMSMEASPLAEIALPVDPVLAGNSYQVNLTSKSDALRNTWYVQQLLSPADESSMVFISEGGDIAGTGSSTTLTLNTAMDYVVGPGSGGTVATAPEHQIWHFAQFFISADLLVFGDSPWTKWVYGSSYAGGLNARGSITVTL